MSGPPCIIHCGQRCQAGLQACNATWAEKIMTRRWAPDAGLCAEIRLLAARPGLPPGGRRLPRGVPRPLWASVSPFVKQGVLGPLDLGVGTCWVPTGRLLTHQRGSSTPLSTRRCSERAVRSGEGTGRGRGRRRTRGRCGDTLPGGPQLTPGCLTCCGHAAGCHSDPALRPGAPLAARPRQEGVGVQGPLELPLPQVRGGD